MTSVRNETRLTFSQSALSTFLCFRIQIICCLWTECIQRTSDVADKCFACLNTSLGKSPCTVFCNCGSESQHLIHAFWSSLPSRMKICDIEKSEMIFYELTHALVLIGSINCLACQTRAWESHCRPFLSLRSESRQLISHLCASLSGKAVRNMTNHGVSSVDT